MNDEFNITLGIEVAPDDAETYAKIMPAWSDLANFNSPSNYSIIKAVKTFQTDILYPPVYY